MMRRREEMICEEKTHTLTHYTSTTKDVVDVYLRADKEKKSESFWGGKSLVSLSNLNGASHVRAPRAAWISWMNHWHTCSAKRQMQTHKHTLSSGRDFSEACFMTCTHQTLPSVLTAAPEMSSFKNCFDCNLIVMCWESPLTFFFFFKLPTHSILLCPSARPEEASTVSARGNVTDLVTPTWVSSLVCFLVLLRLLNI